MGLTKAEEALSQRDEQYKRDLQKIGSAIGYGNAQHILGELWDSMLISEYGIGGRGKMGVTVDDALPPLPKPTKLRREAMHHGGYQMVPAYTTSEMKQFGHAAISGAVAELREIVNEATRILLLIDERALDTGDGEMIDTLKVIERWDSVMDRTGT